MVIFRKTKMSLHIATFADFAQIRMRFNPRRAEQSLQGIDVKVKDEYKYENYIGKLFRKSPEIIDANSF